MVKLIRRWKAPTPPKFKRLFRLSVIIAAGATALMLAEKITRAAGIPDFTFTLLPVTKLICKNLIAAGVVSAAVAKAMVVTKKLDDVQSDVADIKEKTDKLP